MSNRKVVIGLSGVARSGKDTSGLILYHNIGHSKVHSFALPLKQGIKTMFGIDVFSPEWADRKEEIIPELGKSLRDMMQTLGTEWGRQMVHPDVWVYATKQVYDSLPGGSTMILTDVRFQNEADWIRSVDGIIVRLERKGAGTTNMQHASEQLFPMLEGEPVIQNDGDYRDLLCNLERVRNRALWKFHAAYGVQVWVQKMILPPALMAVPI